LVVHDGKLRRRSGYLHDQLGSDRGSFDSVAFWCAVIQIVR